jgi:hypothetical protein
MVFLSQLQDTPFIIVSSCRITTLASSSDLVSHRHQFQASAGLTSRKRRMAEERTSTTNTATVDDEDQSNTTEPVTYYGLSSDEANTIALVGWLLMILAYVLFVINLFSKHYTERLSWFVILTIDLLSTGIADFTARAMRWTGRQQLLYRKKLGSLYGNYPGIGFVVGLGQFLQWAFVYVLPRLIALWLLSSFDLRETLSKLPLHCSVTRANSSYRM